MFIKNLRVDETRFYYCNNLFVKYLERKGFSIVAREKNKMVFSRTKKLQEVLDKMPFYIKLLEKAGDKNGK